MTPTSDIIFTRMKEDTKKKKKKEEKKKKKKSEEDGQIINDGKVTIYRKKEVRLNTYAFKDVIENNFHSGFVSLCLYLLCAYAYLFFS